MSFQVVNLRPLHSGGNGDVYLGIRSDTREHVVVKFLRESQQPHARKGFEREVRILRKGLSGLLPLLGENLTAEKPYYITPFIQAGALSRYSGRLNDLQLHGIAADLAHTLANLHRALIAHGDLKPDNILVGHDGLRVADPLGNGIGCTVLFSQNRGGTPGFWAPEVRSGSPISFAADIYSFGATLYALLTGRTPQDGQTLDPTSEGYQNAPVIRQLISACCTVSPDLRPTIDEVSRILAGEQWTVIQLARQQKQQRFAAVVVLGGLLLLGFGLASEG